MGSVASWCLDGVCSMRSLGCECRVCGGVRAGWGCERCVEGVLNWLLV